MSTRKSAEGNGLTVVASFGTLSDREGRRVAAMLDEAALRGDRDVVERLVASIMPPNARESDFDWGVNTVMGDQRNPRRNGSDVSITDDPLSWAKARTDADYKRIYTKWHWGIESAKKFEWKDPDYPRVMIEIGRLWEIHLIMPDGKKRVLEVDDSHKNDCYAVFDPHHRYQRIYLLCSPSVRKEAARMFWRENDQPPVNQVKAAAIVGGRHGKMKDYGRTPVKLVGAISDLVYRTHKKGDDDHMRGSSYIHELGEESGRMPGLFVDARGRFWILGGAYTCPVPGITD